MKNYVQVFLLREEGKETLVVVVCWNVVQVGLVERDVNGRA